MEEDSSNNDDTRGARVKITDVKVWKVGEKTKHKLCVDLLIVYFTVCNTNEVTENRRNKCQIRVTLKIEFLFAYMKFINIK